MRIANVALSGTMRNSKVLDWLQSGRPDIVTLQKTGRKEDFPSNALREIGYESRCLDWRSRSDPGIALLSHCDLPQPEVCVCELPGAKQQESRFMTVNIGGLWVSSVYAPYSEGFPPKAAIKRRVAWLDRLRDHVFDVGYHDRDSVLCGDFNVKVRADGPPTGGYYSEAEQDALEELMRLGFTDIYRVAHPNPKEEPGFTFGYSTQYPEGTSRLHLVLATDSVAQRLRDVWLDVDSRPRKDAPPLVVDVNGVKM